MSLPANFPPWDGVETLLLDMDGTLLDRHFDDHFFLEVVPRTFARQNGLAFAAAYEHVLATYREVEGTLAWYDLNHWTRVLGFDIPELKHTVAHLIQVHPGVLPFLECMRRSGRPPHLVTNAHHHSLELKMARTQLAHRFATITTSHDLGLPKEDPLFWQRLQERLGFDPKTTLLADDSESVLHSARRYGIGHLLHMARPSSTLAVAHSQAFPSVSGFDQVPWPDSCGDV